jgi:hypothetical protein
MTKAKIEGGRDQHVEENIWTKQRGNGRKMEKIA